MNSNADNLENELIAFINICKIMNNNLLLLLLLIIIDSFKQLRSSADKTLDHYFKTFMNYEDGDGQFDFFNNYVIEVSLEAFKNTTFQ